MDRREYLKLMSLVFGGSAFIPESAYAKMATAPNGAEINFFSESERQLLAAACEATIPRTETPGALDAGVPGYVELIVQDCLNEDDQRLFKEGLAELEQRSGGFAKLDQQKQVELLITLEQESLAQGQERAFIRQLKELVRFCFVNSEVGATKVFDFQIVPGRWEPAMELVAGQKVYVL